MCIKKKAAPGRGSGSNSKGQFKDSQKIVVKRRFLGDYAALLEVYYSDGGKQYRTEVFTKELEILENETEFKAFIGGIIAAQKYRRANA